MSTLTFGIIKPDAVGAGNTGKIIDRVLQGGFNIRGMKLIHQTRKQAEGFYAVARGKGLYEELTDIYVQRAVRRAGIRERRCSQGLARPDGRPPTRPTLPKALCVKEFAASIGENAVHGSDSDENAAIEISYFFSKLELV